jgi:hypothetical protein
VDVLLLLLFNALLTDTNRNVMMATNHVAALYYTIKLGTPANPLSRIWHDTDPPKKVAEEKKGIPPAQQRLICGGK